MNLLIDGFPTEIIDVNGTLYFDTDTLSDEDNEYEGVCTHYQIITDYKAIIDIFMMYEDNALTDEEKAYFMLKMLYIDDIPADTMKAFNKAMEFLNCGKQEDSSKSSKINSRLFSWEQDGNYIYSAMNYSHNEILKREPDLHWWEFYNKFMQLKEDCKFNDIVNNRLAYRKGKMTNEQKAARREFPDMYILKDQRRIDNKAIEEIKRMEDMLNS